MKTVLNKYFDERHTHAYTHTHMHIHTQRHICVRVFMHDIYAYIESEKEEVGGRVSAGCLWNHWKSPKKPSR